MDSVARDPDAAPENTGGLHLMAIKEQPSQNWDNLRNAQKKGEIAALIDLLRARLSHEVLVRICGHVFSGSSPHQNQPDEKRQKILTEADRLLGKSPDWL
jgi:hypothetical protein